MSIVINDVSPRVHYVSTSGQTTFQVPFEFFAPADLKVYVNEQLMFLASPPLTRDQYHTTGAGMAGGGTVVFGPPGRFVNDEVIIFRDMPIARTSDLPTSGPLPVAALNDTFDAQTAMIQQTEINVQKRSLRMSDDDFQEVMNALPTREGRIGRLLGFDFQGQPALLRPSDVIFGGSEGGVSFLGLIWTDDNPPPQPWVDGQLWWKTNAGCMLLYYNDGTSSQWVQVNVESGIVAPGPPVSVGGVHIKTTLLTYAAGTWHKSEGCRWYRLRGVGGGGSGGGVASIVGSYAGSGGGGSGGYGETPWYDAASIDAASYACGLGGVGRHPTDGAGGSPGEPTTWNDGIRSFTWQGGFYGLQNAGYAQVVQRPGGNPGGVTGDFVVRSGSAGYMGMSSNLLMYGGAGGSNPLGQGGAYTFIQSGAAQGGTPNPLLVGYGGGGGGSCRGSAGAGGFGGGNGAPGCIIVEEMF